jgi:hypothetical protein
MTTYPYLFGGFFAEYKLGTYGTVSAPITTRLTHSTASFFLMQSAENHDGSETPRYSKPNRACFCNGWIRWPSHEYINDALVTPASLCFMIMPSRSSIWLISWHAKVHSPAILITPAVLSEVRAHGFQYRTIVPSTLTD